MIADPRRSVMHAAVAAGGASAVLMSYAANSEDDRGVRAAASECLEPLLRAALLVIEAVGDGPGCEQRAALAHVIADFVEVPANGGSASNQTNHEGK